MAADAGKVPIGKSRSSVDIKMAKSRVSYKINHRNRRQIPIMTSAALLPAVSYAHEPLMMPAALPMAAPLGLRMAAPITMAAAPLGLRTIAAPINMMPIATRGPVMIGGLGLPTATLTYANPLISPLMIADKPTEDKKPVEDKPVEDKPQDDKEDEKEAAVVESA